MTSAAAETPAIYASVEKPDRTAFFDFELAERYWSELKNLSQLEVAWGKCTSSEAFDYWNQVWLSGEHKAGQISKTYRFISQTDFANGNRKLQDEYAVNKAQFTLDHIVERYGEEGLVKVQSDLDTVKYCHDISRAYEEWWYTYARATLNPFGRMDYRYIRASFNNWEAGTCEYIGRASFKLFSPGECNDLPEWRTKEEIANYDTALLNNSIQKINKAKKDAKNRDNSRTVIESYLAQHGDTLSKADRKALEEIIKQLQ